MEDSLPSWAECTQITLSPYNCRLKNSIRICVPANYRVVHPVILIIILILMKVATSTDLLFLNIFLYSVRGTHKLFWTVYHQKDFRNKFRPYCASIYIISFSFFAFHIFHIMYFIAVHARTKSLKVLWLFICHFSRPFVYKRFEDKKNIDFTTNYEAAYMFVGTWKSIHKTNENFSFSLRSMYSFGFS